MLQIRKINKEDLYHIKAVIDSNDLFPSEMLDEMTEDFFSNQNTTDVWLTAEVEDVPSAVVYFAPERMTEGTFNLYLIAVHKHLQGKGIGKELINYIENFLKKNGTRILIVETSGLPEFEMTRKFYDACNYEREAVIREFYKKGEDKVVFRKKLQLN